METPPPLLAGFDFTALIWAAFWALVFSASLLPSKRRWQVRAGQTPTPWWVVILETMLGGLVGGVVLSVAAPEKWPELRGPGKQAMLAVAGAAIGPYLGQWIPQAFQAITEQRFGIKLTVKKEGEPTGDGHEEKQDSTAK